MAKTNPFTCRRGLTVKMIGMSVLVGVLIWFAAHAYETRALQEAFEEHLRVMLDEQARRDRIDFDRFGKSFVQVAQLAVGQEAFSAYFSSPQKTAKLEVPYRWSSFPSWFLSRSALRVLAAPRCLLVFNQQRELLETYCRDRTGPPALLRSPSPLLLQKSLGQLLITQIDGVPHMIAAANREVAGQRLTLLLCLPIDELMLKSLNLQHHRLMALVSYNEQRVLVSSDNERIPPGSSLQELAKSYVINGRSFYDDGGAEMMVRLSTFLPRSEMAAMKEAFVEISWRQRTLSALVLLLGPIPIIVWVAWRIRRLTAKVRGFNRKTLRSEQEIDPAGDELCVLDANVDVLMNEVLESHLLIRDETFKEAHLQSMLEQQQQQLELLLLITDALHVGVLTENHSLNAENSLMEKWAAEFGALAEFSSRSGEPEQRTLTDLRGRERVFQLQTMCLSEDETVVLVSELTEQLSAEKERELLQAELLQAQKMESVGRLAGGVAHDFNNILMAIGGNLQLLRRRIGPEPALQKYLKAIDDSSRRAADLTRQLLGFSRKQIVAPKPLSLNRVVSDLLQMLKRLIGENITVRTSLHDGLWATVLDQTQIEQVIMNLAVNARDAMPDGGTLLLETENVTLSADYARTHLGTAPGDYVCLSVSDTGCGIAAAAQKHIFEPFYTTKEQGKGTGLGLSMVYGIVKQNGGDIHVYSEPNEGTTFKIYLPRTQQLAVEASAEPAGEAPRGSETILLVEDDDAVRAFAVEVLSELGYTVIEASDGKAAQRVFDMYHGKVHLLLTDVVLPKMRGQELAERLCQRSSELAVIYMSGYTEDAIVDHGVLKDGINFLPKPLSVENLAQAVRAALDPRLL